MKDVDQIKRDLDNFDKEIKSAENEKMQLTGRIIQAKETLKNSYDIETIEQGQKEIEKLKVEIEKLNTKINESYTFLKENWVL